LIGEENSESELLSMDEEYFMVPANDLDKDTMQLHIINDDNQSSSQFFNHADSVNRSGIQGMDQNPGNNRDNNSMYDS
jgi:hypothetical protein